MEDIDVEVANARMPDVGITATQAVGNDVVDVGRIEGLLGHQRDVVTELRAIGVKPNQMDFFVGIELAAGFFVGQKHLIVLAEGELSEPTFLVG